MKPPAEHHWPLRMVFWESTSLCNLSCLHCRRCDIAAELSRHDLQTQQVKALLDDIAAIGKPIFVFSGGEPLMRPDWLELATHAATLDLPIALATNGTLVDAPIAGLIHSAGFRRVSISLDGSQADTHDAFRNLPGSFDMAIEGARQLRLANVPVQVNCTVARHNVDQLDDLYDLSLRIGAAALHLFLLVPVGCGVQLADSHRITPRQYENVLHWAYQRQRAGELQLRTTCAPHFFRVAAQRRAKDARESHPASYEHADPLHAATRGCLAGISVAFVSHRGEIFPCGYLPVEAGRLDEQPFSQIWNRSDTFAQLRDYTLLKGKCGRCQFRQVCGGCRARAYAQTGDYLDEEPMCSYDAPPRPGAPT